MEVCDGEAAIFVCGCDVEVVYHWGSGGPWIVLVSLLVLVSRLPDWNRIYLLLHETSLIFALFKGSGVSELRLRRGLKILTIHDLWFRDIA